MSENLIRLVGAVNETVGFECVLSAIGQPAASLEIEAEELVSTSGTIDRSAVRLYRHHPVRIERFPNWYLRTERLREPRDFPDALIPLGGTDPGESDESLTILAGSNLPLYVEVRIPRDAKPDTYQSAIVLRDGRGHMDRTAIELVVRDIFLSPNDALPILAGVQPGPIIEALADVDARNLQVALTDDGARHALTQAFSLLHEHGLSPYAEGVRPRLSLGGGGGVDLDWDVYDDFCAPLIDGAAYEDRRPAYVWPMPVDVHQPDPAQYGTMSSSAYRAALQDYLSQVRAHFESRGWLDRSFIDFDYPTALNPTGEEYEQFRKLVATARGIDPKLTILSRLIPQPMSPFGWFDFRYEDFSDTIDIRSTPARYEHAATMEALRSQGKRTWLLPDRPPYSGSLAIEAPLTQSRSLPWQAFLRGHEAVVIPRTTGWPTTILEEPVRERDAASEGWLIYPGKYFGLDQPVPSVRLKQLQIGIQEYQYLRLLEQSGRGETARLLAGSLLQACGTAAYGDQYQDGVTGRRVNDPEIWEQAKSLLSQETALALSEGRDAPVDRSLNLTGWAKFLSSTRRLEAWVESARVAIDPRKKALKYVVTFDVSVRSSLRTNIEGTLSFGALPPDARVVGKPVRIGPIKEWGVIRRSLAFESTTLPVCDLDGHFIQPIVFDAGPSGRVAFDAVVSVAQPVTAAGPIIVDGRLNDWGPGELNVAGDFRLLAGQPAAARPRAERQTVAYFCHSGDVLYVGIRAAAPAESGIVSTPTRRNFVEYEDLMPMDEDLVELILDPTGSGTLSDDLYHIVIKSTGDPVFERGVGVSPPIGRVEAWPGRRPDYAVSINEGGWTAEIAIPLSSLGPRIAPGTLWGMNLARLEPLRGEYSDWARAPRYCYDARSLGNLIWP